MPSSSGRPVPGNAAVPGVKTPVPSLAQTISSAVVAPPQPKTVAAAPKPRSRAGTAALDAVTTAKQRFGALPGMDRFFAMPGMSAANPAAPRVTMHSGPGTPGLRQAYMQALAGGGSNAGNMGMPPGASLRDMRALYGGNPNIMDSSNLRFVAPLIGLQHVYSGQGSGTW